MKNQRTIILLSVLPSAFVLAALAALASHRPGPDDARGPTERPLQSVTLNTHARGVEPGKIDKRSIELTADRDMHIVALEHFIGVGMGSRSDNGHILSTSPENPWAKWEGQQLAVVVAGR